VSCATSSPCEPNRETTCLPSVAGVEEACVAFVWRFVLGSPSRTTLSQTILPVALSKAMTRHVCAGSALTGSTSP
jgi:hypothetical protein